MAKNGNRGLSPRQRRGIMALLTARNTEAAAQVAGVGPRTMYRWLTEPDFQAALMAAEAEALNSATRQLTALASEAVAALRATLADPTTAAPVRVRAADVVLGQLMHFRDSRDMEHKLEVLQTVLEAVWTKREPGNG